MPLPNLYAQNQRARVPTRSDPRNADFYGGQDYPNPGNDMDVVIDDIERGYPGGGNPWPTTNSGFGGVGTDPSVGNTPGIVSGVDRVSYDEGIMPVDSGGGFSLPPWLTNIIGGGGSGGGMDPRQAAYLAAGMGMAGKQWNDAGRIEDSFNQWASDADWLRPDRQRYAGQLAGLMADPSQIENDPAYQFRLQQGLNALGPKLAAKGGGYGNAGKAMVDYAGNAATQELDAQTARLSNLAGFQFDQGRTAADLRTAGLTGSIASQNAALGSAMFGLNQAFMPQGTGGNQGGGGGSNGGIRIPGGSTISGGDAERIGQIIAGGGAGAAQAIGGLLQQGIKTIQLPDGTSIDLEAAARAGGGDTGMGGYAPYPTDIRGGYTTGGGDPLVEGGAYQPGDTVFDPGYTGEDYYPIGYDYDPGYTGDYSFQALGY